LRVCEHVLEGKQHPCAKNRIWKRKSALYAATKYIIRHYTDLTVYLDHPDLFAENNATERGLRQEKTIEDAAKFRFSEQGRVALDIIRSLIATCRAAEIDFNKYRNYSAPDGANFLV